MKTKLLLILAVLVFIAEPVMSLTIIPIFDETNMPTNFVGGGNWKSNILAECKYYESRIRDNATLTIRCEWAPIGHKAEFTLTSTGGTPNRITEGTIQFRNNAWWSFYMDPAPLSGCTRSAQCFEESVDLGEGSVNASRYFTGITTNTQVLIDFRSVVRHEIGHALGLAYGYDAFEAHRANGYIEISGGQFKGMRIPLDYAEGFGYTSHLGPVATKTMMSTAAIESNMRIDASDIDLLAIAEVSHFTQLKLGTELKVGISTSVANRGENGKMLDLSWVPVLPMPQGTTHYVVQSSANIQGGCWTTIECAVSQSNGTYSTTVLATADHAFFRLKAE